MAQNNDIAPGSAAKPLGEAPFFQSAAGRAIRSKPFALFIGLAIVANSILIGIETYGFNPLIAKAQSIILGIFTAELVIRFIAAGSAKKFFFNGWHLFDLAIVAIGFVPESLFENAMAITALRILRVFRIMRIVRAIPEVQIIAGVLARSVSTLIYNALFFIIFLYMFSVIASILFKLPAGAAPYDPYGTLVESAFTLFRITTGYDWTELRSGLQSASEQGLISVSNFAITLFHITWYVLSAFLLLNLVVAAVVNNYQEVKSRYKL